MLSAERCTESFLIPKACFGYKLTYIARLWLAELNKYRGFEGRAVLLFRSYYLRISNDLKWWRI